MSTTTRILYDHTRTGSPAAQTEVTEAPPQPSSVELTQDAKGQAKICVKVYDEDPEQAAQQALALYRRLTQALATGEPLAAP